MKQIIQTVFLLAALTITTGAAAQTKPAFLKYEVNGQPYSLAGDDIGSYYTQDGDGAEVIKHTEYHFYTDILKKAEFHLSIEINTPSKTKPVVGRLPYVGLILPIDGILPSAYINIDRYIGDDMSFYACTLLNEGNFEITKVEGNWIEGKFDLVISNEYEENDHLKVTNGTFRLNLGNELTD